MKLSITILLCFIYSTALAELPIQPFQASYDVFVKTFYLGNGSITLQDKGQQRYEMTIQVQPNELAALLFSERIQQLARGIFTAQGPQPLYYQHRRTGGSKQQLTELHFDWPAATLTITHKQQTEVQTLALRTMDPLSLYVQAMWDLQRHQQPETYRLVEKGRLKTYHMTYHGLDTIKTTLGDLPAQRISQSTPGDSRKTTFWFATELHYLPVQIQQTKNGREEFRLTLQALQR